MKDWRMKNGEVFDTDARGELVVNNPVEDGCDDASDRNFKGFHRGIGLDQILTVVTSLFHSLTLVFGEQMAHADERLVTTVENFCPECEPGDGRWRASQRQYYSLAYSALASFRMGMLGSASFQRAKKSW